jgi:hypothetical protein
MATTPTDCGGPASSPALALRTAASFWKKAATPATPRVATSSARGSDTVSRAATSRSARQLGSTHVRDSTVT